MRAFLAIELTKEMKERYGCLYASCRERFRDLRWVRPENLHLTLRFLGEADDHRLERLRREIEPAIRSLLPIAFAVGAPAGFGGRGAPRTLWLGVDPGGEELAALAGRVEAAARKAGFAPEKKERRKQWEAHITLARNPKGAAVRGWEETAAASGLPGLYSTVDGITLFSSLLLPEGPQYTAVWKVPSPQQDPLRPG